MAITVDYDELDGSPEESGTWHQFQAVRRLKCAYVDRHALMTEALLLPGDLYPYKMNTLARCKQASAIGRGKYAGYLGGGTTPNYEYAEITLAYATPEYGDPEQPGGPGTTVISETLEPTAEFQQLKYQDFAWGSVSGPDLHPEEAPGLLLNGLEYVYKRHHATTIPPAALSFVGCVNAATVNATLLAGLSFAPETLLFNPPSIERVHTSAGAGAFTLVYRFTFKPAGWNTYFRADKTPFAGFDQIYRKLTGDVYRSYPLADFTQL